MSIPIRPPQTGYHIVTVSARNHSVMSRIAELLDEAIPSDSSRSLAIAAEEIARLKARVAELEAALAEEEEVNHQITEDLMAVLGKTPG